MDGVGTAMGIPTLLPPLFSRLPLPPLLPLKGGFGKVGKGVMKGVGRDRHRKRIKRET